MTTLELKYNPFSIKTDFLIDGKEASLKCFGTGIDIRLKDYIGDFFSEAMKKLNLGPGSECSLQFYGTQDDFEDVKEAYQKYNGLSEGIKIELLEYKSYPNNFSEMYSIISLKIEQYKEQIKNIKEKSSYDDFNIDLLEIGLQLGREEKIIQDTYFDNISNMNIALNNIKDNFNLFINEKITSCNISIISRIGNFIGGHSTSLNELISNLCGMEKPEENIQAVKKPLVMYATSASVSKKSYEEYYALLENIKTLYVKSSIEVKDLLALQINNLNNNLGIILNKYITEYSKYLPEIKTNKIEYIYTKNILNINEKLPENIFDNIKIKKLENIESSDGIYKVQALIKDTLSECISYFQTTLEASEQNYKSETEKCKNYYLDELQKLQKPISELLTNIINTNNNLQSKIQCLNDLQNEINILENK